MIWWPDETEEDEASRLHFSEVNGTCGVTIAAQRRPITEPDVNQQLTTEWDGEGLPPVGCIVECFTGKNWHQCKVVLTGEPGSETEALVYNVKTTRPFWADEFRPIRSAEDVARDEAVAAMINHKDDFIQPQTYYHAIYDAIAAGKIPGVKLE